MKKLISILLLFSMVLTLNTFTAAAAEPASNDTKAVSTDSGVSPRIIFSYEKEVVHQYAFMDSIPDHISYSEYSDQYHGYFSGTLWLDHVLLSADGYFYAWFIGTLTGTI